MVSTGALNGDGKPDAAMVLQQQTLASNLRRNESFGPKELDLDPHRLLVLLRIYP